MQTHLHLLEQAISFSTQGTRLCCYWQGASWLPQQLNSTNFHEMGKDQAYQFTSNDHQCINPLWSHLDFFPSQLLREASKRNQQSNLQIYQLERCFSTFIPHSFQGLYCCLGKLCSKVGNNLNSCKNLKELQCKYWTDVFREERSRKYWFYHFHKFSK